jgi:hypothetical protein
MTIPGILEYLHLFNNQDIPWRGFQNSPAEIFQLVLSAAFKGVVPTNNSIQPANIAFTKSG